MFEPLQPRPELPPHELGGVQLVGVNRGGKSGKGLGHRRKTRFTFCPKIGVNGPCFCILRQSLQSEVPLTQQQPQSQVTANPGGWILRCRGSECCASFMGFGSATRSRGAIGVPMSIRPAKTAAVVLGRGRLSNRPARNSSATEGARCIPRRSRGI